MQREMDNKVQVNQHRYNVDHSKVKSNTPHDNKSKDS